MRMVLMVRAVQRVAKLDVFVLFAVGTVGFFFKGMRWRMSEDDVDSYIIKLV